MFGFTRKQGWPGRGKAGRDKGNFIPERGLPGSEGTRRLAARDCRLEYNEGVLSPERFRSTISAGTKAPRKCNSAGPAREYLGRCINSFVHPSPARPRRALRGINSARCRWPLQLTPSRKEAGLETRETVFPGSPSPLKLAQFQRRPRARPAITLQRRVTLTFHLPSTSGWGVFDANRATSPSINTDRDPGIPGNTGARPFSSPFSVVSSLPSYSVGVIRTTQARTYRPADLPGNTLAILGRGSLLHRQTSG